MPISKAELVQMIKAIPNWQKMNKHEISAVVSMDRSYISRVMKEHGMKCDHKRRKSTAPRKTAIDWTQYKKPKDEVKKLEIESEKIVSEFVELMYPEVKEFSKQEREIFDKNYFKSKERRCKFCVTKKQQCRICYSKDLIGRPPLEPDFHMIEPRGVYV